jgi:GT2 family glycosyltransferase
VDRRTFIWRSIRDRLLPESDLVAEAVVSQIVSGVLDPATGRVMPVSGVSIIIPTYNRAELLGTALESVQRLLVPKNWEAEILVIDNNSSDHTAAVVRDAKQGPLPVRWLLEMNQGASHARNRGASEAAFEHLIYFDDDELVDAGWLEAYVAVQAAYHPDCIVGPVEPLFEQVPPKWMTSAILNPVTSSYSRKGPREGLLPPAHAHEIPGGNFGVLRSVFFEVGGFHPAMLAGEDFEFGARLVLSGKNIAYAPGCRIRHRIDHQKLSPIGLCARSRGWGATQRALMQLRGDPLSAMEQLRLLLRLARFFSRDVGYRLQNKKGHALECKLETERISGLLFTKPSHRRITGVKHEREHETEP